MAAREDGAGPARPRPAASLVVLRGPPEAAQVLMGRRPATARFMPGRFVFPGGVREREDKTLAWTALRETWEETGLLLASAEPCAAKGPPDLADAYAAAGLHPALDSLQPIARAVTPDFSPIRFDTVFYLAVGAQPAGAPAPDGELEAVGWHDTETALARYALADITEAVLREAAEHYRTGTLPGCRPAEIRHFFYDGEGIKAGWERWVPR